MNAAATKPAPKSSGWVEQWVVGGRKGEKMAAKKTNTENLRSVWSYKRRNEPKEQASRLGQTVAFLSFFGLSIDKRLCLAVEHGGGLSDGKEREERGDGLGERKGQLRGSDTGRWAGHVVLNGV